MKSSKFTVRHHARGLQGEWFRYSGVRVFNTNDAAVQWAAARLDGLSGHRCDVWHNRRVVATVYSDGRITRFEEAA